MSYLRKLILTVIGVNLFVILLAGLSAWQGYRHYVERAQANSQNLVTALEANLVDAIQRVDLTLQGLRDIHESQLATGRIDAERMGRYIEQARQRLPDAEAIRIADRQGMLVLGSGVDPARRISLADRPHFINARDQEQDLLVMSNPLHSRVNNRQVIVLSRRLHQPDGSFNGTLFATLALDHFTTLFATLDLGPRGVVFLRDAELGLVARYPPLNQPGMESGQIYRSPEFAALQAANQTRGTYSTAASPDQTARTLSFRKLADYPLYAFVGLAADDYLAPWRSDLRGMALLVLLFVVASVTAARIQFRGWLRQQHDTATIARQEALYHELVEDTPVMVVRYRPDTEITFANTAFAAFFGTSAQALLGRRLLTLLIEEADQAAMRQRIAGLGPLRLTAHDVLYRVRGKDGQTHWTQWTERAVFDDNGRLDHLQAIGEDITERKRSRDVQAARLRLMEYAVDHSMQELLVATLDEAGELTESPIGFYHFLAADQKTLSLQAWSTRTLREYCHAEGEGRHYNIDEAGVWVEAIRLRQPVIHNDYAALPNKHGLPPGHAVVLREMVIPVFRKGPIVAILGVGNKPTPYTDYDLQTVALLADLAWDFAESKRLEAELVEMATSDFLTGLLNRRHFLVDMGDELNRLKRFDIPASAVLMLDLDHFKQVNDQHGHAAGDAVLKHFAGLIRAELRKVDTAGRLGGEEFGILLLGADRADALQFAERLRATVAATPLTYQGVAIAITVSIGITLLDGADAGPEDALARADAALYDAKHGGRNRVCTQSP